MSEADGLPAWAPVPGFIPSGSTLSLLAEAVLWSFHSEGVGSVSAQPMAGVEASECQDAFAP